MTGYIKKSKREEIKQRLLTLGVKPEDIKEEFIRGSGPGGQKINKANICVQITHRPSGITVKCQQTRSRESNRFFARRILAEKLEQKIRGKESLKEQLIRKIRAQKKKRSRRAREKMLRQKHHRSEIKLLRKKTGMNSSD